MDIIGPLPKTNRGNEHILVISDHLTKWVEAYPIEKADTDCIAEKFVNEFMSRHGAPMRLLTDRGQVFRSQLLKSIVKTFNTKKIFTSSYHPQTDGQTERFNSTLERMISMFVSQHQTDWDEFMPQLLFAYRRTIHRSTGDTPYYLLYGRDPRCPTDASLHVTLHEDDQPMTPATWKHRSSRNRDTQHSRIATTPERRI